MINCSISGLINVNKPAGITSFSVVKHVREILNVKKVGHCGTLDPLAEGVLLVLYGSATKLQDRFMAFNKTYRAKFVLGITTDTGDISGNVISEVIPDSFSESQIKGILKNFIGEVEQTPPMYSALKHNGKRLYELARKGVVVDRKLRKIKIYSIELISVNDNTIEVRVNCSKGTYIRTLCEDIGKALKCGATMTQLCRERIGNFDINKSVNDIVEKKRDELLMKAYSPEELEQLF
ncbi:tRNA pseudouridine(55) synthase TruB [Elusimicrobiota bacterium]